MADVSQPTIGVDFLEHYKLLVNVAGRRRIDSVSKLTSAAGLKKSRHISLYNQSDDGE